ncbi:cytochrome c oxidase accessory protein CcoG [Salinarimonas ramus]|uniref:Cytochrome c oxidase accessory protein CcoG n=1 Tax=Salinarimonas ramus TaxID=690164 RepID=A0A917V8L7_9HYPH|nr:cytochrome c oxidase accessory protein CcoG [Salinarimonas ramus]GGK49855.1 cytochrome c oxidase accessory protein CcoG [Salinarimonas ramus]
MADTATPNPARNADELHDDTAETLIEGPLYVSRRQLYVQSVKGTFRKIKWAVLVATLGVYYLLPFVRWDRGPNAPDQAVLIDFPARRFYFFFIEIWPQEIVYLTGLLILASFVLFLMNAVAGRVWCGYLCPQTVWTDLFLAVERFFEGDRRERLKLHEGGWTGNRIARTSGKHFVWLMIAWWTGGAWVLYFADAPTLVWNLATLQAPAVAYVWIGILTFTTYTLAGFMREQVCTYMCPWPRIQAALTDEHALNVTYKVDRGEPRASVKKAKALREHGEPAGDCIDCNQCVAVCPTGVDIRDGLQLGCVQCGLCIDACDNVMDKIGRPKGLIAYDSEYNLERREAGLPEEKPKIVRARTILYAVLIVGISLFMAYHLAIRSSLDVSALHDRNPLYVLLSDGSIRNAYTIRVSNKELEERAFTLSLEGLDGARVEAVGATNVDPDTLEVVVGPAQTRELRVLVTDSAAAGAPESRAIAFVLVAPDGGESAIAQDHFIKPAR